ncbi:hypothetical protein BN871_EU_00230 [Paenibacillus sp. P22]|nr:hypothetical protein BN871_EU_00230 [Paenibacillus sp. P22]
MKVDRLLAITVLLLSRKRVSAREMAERFEVSAKTNSNRMIRLKARGTWKRASTTP